MKRLLLLTALLPFVGFAQPINTLNNPNQPGYQIPSQQRMQTQMQTQQIQQKTRSTIILSGCCSHSRGSEIPPGSKCCPTPTAGC